MGESKIALIWKKSIYKNNFKCTCGNFLFNGKEPIGCGFDANLSNRQDILYCIECKKPVAVIKKYEGDLPPGSLGGHWKGGLN